MVVREVEISKLHILSKWVKDIYNSSVDLNKMFYMVFSCRNKAWYVMNILFVCVRGSLVHCVYFIV